jgi:hypothetical protein
LVQGTAELNPPVKTIAIILDILKQQRYSLGREGKTMETIEKYVVNSNAGDAINGKVFDSYVDALQAIRGVYGEDEISRLHGELEGEEAQTEIVSI